MPWWGILITIAVGVIVLTWGGMIAVVIGVARSIRNDIRNQEDR